MTGEACVFCKIVRGEIPAERVYENESFLAFLDAQPCAAGHTLIVPKRHVAFITDLSAAEAPLFVEAIQEVIGRIEPRVHAEGFTLGINHGPAAHPGVKHFHFHVIPRFLGDGGGSLHTVVPRK